MRLNKAALKGAWKKKTDVLQLYRAVNSFIITITELLIFLFYFITDILTDFYVVDWDKILYINVFAFLFSLFFYSWQYPQNGDTYNTVMN